SAASSLSKRRLSDRRDDLVRAGLRSVSDQVAGAHAYGLGSGAPTKHAHIGRAAASNWLIGGRPRISSIVRSMLQVEDIADTTAPRRTHGPATRATVRWASTWSGPFCASSSTTNTARCGQKRERDRPSSTRPSARSLSATAERGAILPAVPPDVWSFESRST